MKRTFLILSNAANLERFALRGGDWQSRSGSRRVDILPRKSLTYRVTLCMRAKHKNELCFYRVQHVFYTTLRQLQITFPRIESMCFKDAFLFCKPA